MLQNCKQRWSVLFFAMTVIGLIAPRASAGLMLEPYIGYSQGQAYDTRPLQGLDLSYKTSGVGVGARLGYTFPVMFWTALDYSMGNGKGKQDLTGLDGNLSRSDLYAVFGFDFPILLRAWIGYGLMNSSTLTLSGSDYKYSGGTNLKAGIGISVFPFVSMNLEAFAHKGQKIENGGTSITSEDYVDGGGMLSLSVPLDL